MSEDIPLKDAWTTARDRFVEDLSPEEQALYSNATVETIFYEASAAEKIHGSKSRSRRLVVEKLKPLVDAIEQYGTALDVIANTSAMVLCPLWGGIRVVLCISREYGEFFDRIQDMFHKIGDALPRCRQYEKLFRKHRRLMEAITSLYVEILTFCVDAKSIFHKNKRPFVLNSLLFLKISWKPFQERFTRQLRRFREQGDLIDKEANLCHMLEEADSQALEEFNRMQVEKEKQEKERLRILGMLFSTDYEHKHCLLQRKQHPGTCRWIRGNEKFQDWLDSAESANLHIQGIPGSGKSILASFIVSELQRRAQSKGHCVAYHYCDYADRITLDASAIIRSLLHQLVRNVPMSEDLCGGLKKGCRDGLGTPDVADLRPIFDTAIDLYPCTYLVLDGLNERDKLTRGRILDIVKQIARSQTSTLKVLLLSQTDVQISGSLQAFPHIQITPAALSVDLDDYITESVRSHIGREDICIEDPRLESEMISELRNKAQGMFLWVVFQLQDLCEATSDAGIRDILRDLPDGLYETYRRKVKKITGRQRIEMAGKVFRWLSCATRPLSIEEMQEAVAFDHHDTSWATDKIPLARSVLGCCENLVIREDDASVRFAHHSVMAFLLSDPSRRGSHPFQCNLQAANILAAEVCVSYLSFTDFETQLETRSTGAPVESTAGLSSGALRFMSSVLHVSSKWFSIPYRLFGGSCDQEPVNVNLKWVAQPSKSPATPVLVKKYQFLHYAIDNWETHTKSLLYEHDRCYSFVDGVSVEMFEQFTRLVFNKNMIFSHRSWVIDPRSRQPNLSAFRWALENNHLSLMWLLLESSHPSTSFRYLSQLRENTGTNPLAIPCSKGFVDILKLLLKYDRQLPILLDEDLLISHAVPNGQDDVVRMLLDHGVPITARRRVLGAGVSSPKYAIEVAREHGQDKVLHTLLSRHNDSSTSALEYEKARDRCLAAWQARNQPPSLQYGW